MKDLFDKILELCNENEINASLDLLYNTIDDWCLDGEFRKVDDLMYEMDIEKFPDYILIGVLAITFPFYSQLELRRFFYGKVFMEFKLRKIDNVKELLNGLWRGKDG